MSEKKEVPDTEQSLNLKEKTKFLILIRYLRKVFQQELSNISIFMHKNLINTFSVINPKDLSPIQRFFLSIL